MLSLIPPVLLVLAAICTILVSNSKKSRRKNRQIKNGDSALRDFVGKEIVKNELRQNNRSRRQRRPLGITYPIIDQEQTAKREGAEIKDFILVPRNGRH